MYNNKSLYQSAVEIPVSAVATVSQIHVNNGSANSLLQQLHLWQIQENIGIKEIFFFIIIALWTYLKLTGFSTLLSFGLLCIHLFWRLVRIPWPASARDSLTSGKSGSVLDLGGNLSFSSASTRLTFDKEESTWRSVNTVQSREPSVWRNCYHSTQSRVNNCGAVVATFSNWMKTNGYSSDPKHI